MKLLGLFFVAALVCVSASDYDSLLNDNKGSFLRKAGVRPLATSVMGHIYLQDGVALTTDTEIDLSTVVDADVSSPTYSLNDASDPLPTGLVIDGATGIIGGTPSGGVNASIKIDACDADGLCSTMAPFIISVSTLVTTPTCSERCSRDTRGPCQHPDWFDNNCFEFENPAAETCPANTIDCTAAADVVFGWSHSISPSISVSASETQTRSRSALASYTRTRTQSYSPSPSSQPSRSRSFSVSPTRTRSVTASNSKSRTPRMSNTQTATSSVSATPDFVPVDDCGVNLGTCGDRTCVPDGGLGDGYHCEKSNGCQIDFGEADPCPEQVCTFDEADPMTAVCVDP